MRQLTLKVIIPATIISFAVFTKWWYALPADAPDTMYWGFPFVYIGEGWGSSMTLQIFLFEFIADLLVYFLFWFSIIWLIDYLIVKINPYKALTIFLWSLSTIIIAFNTLIWSNKDNTFYTKREYKFDVLTTGYQFEWDNVQRPDYYKYRPQKK
jgi:hypothetical protein